MSVVSWRELLWDLGRSWHLSQFYHLAVLSVQGSGQLGDSWVIWTKPKSSLGL